MYGLIILSRSYGILHRNTFVIYDYFMLLGSIIVPWDYR